MTQTQLIVAAVMQNEIGVFLLLGIAFILLAMFFCWVIREWSWIPRKRHNRQFVERF